MHVEDRLQELYFKSRMLSEYLKTTDRIDIEQLAAMLGSVAEMFASGVSCWSTMVNGREDFGWGKAYNT